EPLSSGLWPWFSHILLPAATVGIISGSIMTRFVRSALLEVLGQDFVRTAHAKGVPRQKVLRKHVTRNAAISIVTIIGLQMATLLSAVVVVEIIFAWPGLGQLALTATLQRDYPAPPAAVLLSAVIFTVVNPVTDLSYTFLDPRVTYSRPREPDVQRHCRRRERQRHHPSRSGVLAQSVTPRTRHSRRQHRAPARRRRRVWQPHRTPRSEHDGLQRPLRSTVWRSLLRHRRVRSRPLLTDPARR